MAKLRYSIMGVMYGSEEEKELCQVGSNPDVIADGYRNKYLLLDLGQGSRSRSSVAKYTTVRVVENKQP